MSTLTRCSHVLEVGNLTRKDILFAKEKCCNDCTYKGVNKWICLKEGCLYVGCGAKQQDHAGKHSAEHNHALQLNVKNSRIWCNVCDVEIIPSQNIPLWEIGERLLLDKPTARSKQQQQQQLSANKREPADHNSGLSTSSSLAAVVEAERKRENIIPYPGSDKISIADEGKSHVPSIHSVPSPMDTKGEHQQQRNFEPYPDLPNVFSAGRLYREREHPTAVSDYYVENLKDYQVAGLNGLRNLGNTCYMNAALQSLSNCPPLTDYLLNCRLPADPNYPCLASVYQKLMRDMWDERRRPSYLVPYEVLHVIRSLHPSFRGYQQQDAQEFLRCFLDALHEDIKQPVYEWECQVEDSELQRGRVSSDQDSSANANTGKPGNSTDQEDEHFLTCDSGWSSDREILKSKSRSESSMKLRRRAAKSECHEGTTPKSDSSEFSEAPTEFVSAFDLASARRTTKRRTTVRISPERVPKKRPVRYRSIVSDVFDGRLLSAVQCLTCKTVSETRETFQDLSLSIPTRDQLEMMKNSRQTSSSSSSNAADSNMGWLSWTYSLFKNWAYGPTISLEDCFAAFFSADDLKGDDMYSCDRCKKLRNGVKFCSLLRLPEILCIHLKRFRHEMVYSSKISTYISFPIDNLNLSKFVHKNSKDEVHLYDLFAIICHRGSVEGGHYTAYCLNPLNFRWYEFDDQYATEVDVTTVQNAEAYVLFYRKKTEKMDRLRQDVMKALDSKQSSLMKFYISREWVHRFNTFAEPGPVTNFDFLCPHGWIAPSKAEFLSDLHAEIPDKVWHMVYKHFGGGPVCCQLRHCFECQQHRQRLMTKRRAEYTAFSKLQKDIQRRLVIPDVLCGLSTKWFRKWEEFVLDKEEEPPGPISNNDIVAKRNDRNEQARLLVGSNYIQLTKEMWDFFHSNYGGGPEVVLTGNPLGLAKSKQPQQQQQQQAITEKPDSNEDTVKEESTVMAIDPVDCPDSVDPIECDDQCVAREESEQSVDQIVAECKEDEHKTQ